jgi:hypothetical protein
MLVGEYTADGKTKKWREQQNNLKYAAFQVPFLFRGPRSCRRGADADENAGAGVGMPGVAAVRRLAGRRSRLPLLVH